MKLEKILIKRMTNEHINDILKIEQLCFANPWTENMFIEELKHENVYYFIAENLGRAIGYIGFWHIIDEGHITNICILPEFQKKGIGSMLLQNTIAYMQQLKINSITLEVREGNKKALCFYEKFGFNNEGIRKNYYSNPRENAIIMWKKL